MAKSLDCVTHIVYRVAVRACSALKQTNENNCSRQSCRTFEYGYLNMPQLVQALDNR